MTVHGANRSRAVTEGETSRGTTESPPARGSGTHPQPTAAAPMGTPHSKGGCSPSCSVSPKAAVWLQPNSIILPMEPTFHELCWACRFVPSYCVNFSGLCG